MTLTDERLREILAGCDKATPGPWTACLHSRPVRDAHIRAEIHQCNIADVIEGTESSLGHVSREDCEANAAHIAHCDPQTIRALVEELLGLRERKTPASRQLVNLSKAMWEDAEAENARIRNAALDEAAKAGMKAYIAAKDIEAAILALKTPEPKP